MVVHSIASHKVLSRKSVSFLHRLKMLFFLNSVTAMSVVKASSSVQGSSSALACLLWHVKDTVDWH